MPRTPNAVSRRREIVVTQAPRPSLASRAPLGAKTHPLRHGQPKSSPGAESCRAYEDGEPLGLHRGDAFAPGNTVLTFDDGPYPDRTPVVLDLLAKHRFAATFFVLGRHTTRHTYALLQRMETEGHVIASHSYDHDIQMASRHTGATRSIRSQHETTRILIEIALLAASPDHFDEMYEAVFVARPAARRTRATMSLRWPQMAIRHRTLLAAHGFPNGRYAVRYSRPPGGGPFLGRSLAPRARYSAALRWLGMANVMWHHQAGDVHHSKARDFHYLVTRLTRGAQRGGILLIHDFIRADALSQALGVIAADPNIAILSIDHAMQAKYGCPSATVLRPTLRERRSQPPSTTAALTPASERHR